MAELKWTDSAVTDLEDIISYIARDSEDYAKIYARRMIDSIETMAVFPFSGRVVPEMNNEMIREKVFANYRIIYMVSEDKIDIVRIIHHARRFNDMDV